VQQNKDDVASLTSSQLQSDTVVKAVNSGRSLAAVSNEFIRQAASTSSASASIGSHVTTKTTIPRLPAEVIHVSKLTSLSKQYNIIKKIFPGTSSKTGTAHVPFLQQSFWNDAGSQQPQKTLQGKNACCTTG